MIKKVIALEKKFCSYASKRNNLPIYFLKKRKGQSSIVDAFFFLMICSSAAVLMVYTSGLFGSTSSRQISMIYNVNFANNVLIALHYAEDINHHYFWNELRDKLTHTNLKTDVESYLNDNKVVVWNKIASSSPSSAFALKFEGSSSFYCFPSTSVALPVSCEDALPSSPVDYSSLNNVFTSSTKLKDIDGHEWVVSFQLYY